MPGKPDGERKQESADLQKLVAPTAKKLGEAVEAAFLAKATMLGFPVLKPWGDSRPYDFAVESGRRLVAGAGEVRDQPSRYAMRCQGRRQRGALHAG